MIKITTKKGKKGDNDKVIYVDSYKITNNDIVEQILMLIDKHGEEKIRKELSIKKRDHRKFNTKKWTLKETKKIVNMICKNKYYLYTKSKGKQGSDYFKSFISRMIFRHQKRKSNNL